MKKTKLNYPLISYLKVLHWAKSQMPEQSSPILIPKYGGKSHNSFRMWVFANNLLLTSSEKDKKQTQYILNREKWDMFCRFVKMHPEMGTREFAKHYKDYGCTNYMFWPSIISINKQYYEQKEISL